MLANDAHTVPQHDMAFETRQDLPATSRSRQNLEVSSPVNENGSFERDRVIKSGLVSKRTRRTKQWKDIYMFLRPQSLSIYRDSEGTVLRHHMALTEVTAVTRQKDPKGRMSHVFGVFTSSRNYCLAARSEKEAQEWVEVIGCEARIDQDEYDMGVPDPHMTVEQPTPESEAFTERCNDQIAIYSSSDVERAPHRGSTASPLSDTAAAALHATRQSRAQSQIPDTAGDTFSYSDFSDTAGATMGMSSVSLALPAPAPEDHDAMLYTGRPLSASHTNLAPSKSQRAAIEAAERVSCHGWVKYLKTGAHLRQWKKVWMVLRPKSLALYKDEDEYAAIHVLPFDSIIDAIDIDPLGDKRRCCMQIIAEDREYKFALSDEDELARWLGCFKSLLQKRKDQLRARDAA